jgi:hypothetical protein
MATSDAHVPIRGTQLLVEHMSSVFRRPSLVAIEIAWRWLFGIPFLFFCFEQGRQILSVFSLESSGFNSIDTQNPWVAATQIGGVIAYYEPHIRLLSRWLLPVAAVAWIVVSGLGRSLLLSRLQSAPGSRLPLRPMPVLFSQAAWLALFGVTVWCWFRSMQWVSARHITIAGEPNLIGFFIWAIFLTLGFFTAWALVSWTVSIAPLLSLLENRSAISALGQSLRLGLPLASKLAEINLVLGIAKLTLMVLAMVFSAAPLPFSDELGPAAMHFASACSFVFFLVADDFCQVVRLKAFLEFWKLYRGPGKI